TKKFLTKRFCYSRAPPSPPPMARAPPSPPPTAPVPPPPRPRFPPPLLRTGSMASTATGVAVGSGAGATVTQTMTGGLGGGQSEPARPDITQVSPGLVGPQQQQQQACSEEMRSFLACAINTSDLKVCEGVNEALKNRCFSSLLVI
uniref:Coiled-coil-helix-coiled-coil-helix domain containing 2 n=1 Tax=Oreochromis niloticus TaxID=8128 RepID=A0A669EYB6_ORENI